MTAQPPEALVRRLLAIARAAGAKGHLAIKSPEGHGYCRYRPVGGHVVKVGRGFRIEGQTLGRVLGTVQPVIVSWIESGRLRSTRLPGPRTARWIATEDVEDFLRAYPFAVPWQRIQHPQWRELVRQRTLRGEWLSTTQVARLVGADPLVVSRWCFDGLIPGALRRSGAPRGWQVIPRASVDAVAALADARLGVNRNRRPRRKEQVS